jgi:hypothetical protein
VHIYLSIDDTDNLESPGSGQLSEFMVKELQDLGLTSQCSNISRHQLFVHETIPYTSHNSSMCFSAVINDNNLSDVIQFTKEFLEKSSAQGSDPGLCIAVDGESLDRKVLIDFGLKAKQTVVTKQEAYSLAKKTGVHLSEHGGTGDGIVGALAGVGLRLHGSDGRFRGWLSLGKAGQITSREFLCSHPSIDAVVDEEGNILPDDSRITLAEDKIKTVFLNHHQVLPVTRTCKIDGPAWTTLTKSEIKRF